MKSIKFFAMAAVAALIMSCGSKPYDSSKVNELTDKLFSLTSEDYPEVVKQADGILTYGLFGGDTDLFKQMNQLDNALYGMEDQMDDATKEAYAKYQEHRKAVLGH